MKQITFKHRGTRLYMTILLPDFHSSCTFNLGDGIEHKVSNTRIYKISRHFPESTEERTITVTGDVSKITMHKKTKFSERSEFIVREME